ncbi:hypothetical protein U0070_020552 [Myodes glareolus]|uniref:Uncharacterized protein n=1 Tax=Myodes glareolus TaxID=447135 RepID=A0AAW0JCU5_MYOGA
MRSPQLMRFVFYVCNQQRQLTVMKNWTAFRYHQQVIYLSPGERPRRTRIQAPLPRLAF